MSASPVTEARIEAEVRSALAATLRVDPATIDFDRPIMQSLGATSIDFLDINFRLESAFGIQLATQLLLDHVEEVLGEGVAIDRGGRITAPAARLLAMHLGDLPELAAGLDADEVPGLVTPRLLARSVAGILASLPATCPACGASAWTAPDGLKVACGSCQKPAAYPTGDELTQDWIRRVQDEQHLFPTA